MSVSAQTQDRIQELNRKLETQAQSVVDGIERELLRKFTREAHVCHIQCIDTHATNPRTELYEVCARQCDGPRQHASNVVRQEVATFQNRLNRSLQDCQDRARDAMVPGYEKDAKKMQKVEDTFVKCISNVTDEYIKLLKPMKERIIFDLKQISDAAAKSK